MQITGYSVQEKLHQGKHFEVYRAVGDKETPSILKVLNKEKLGTTDKETIANEYRLLKMIDSEFVLRAVDWIEDETYLGIVLEDINGTSLKQEIKARTLPVEKFMTIAIRVTQGLAAIHDQNIVHKDVNPTNIIWNSQTDFLKIIDFNIASKFDVQVSHSGNPEKLQGTLPYISPEQTGRTSRRVDQRSDLYSLGVTFYEMLTGKLPFEHSDPMEIVYAHLALDPAPPSLLNDQVPEILSRIILRLLAKKPGERYQSAEGLKYDLEKAVKSNFEDFKLGENDFSGKLRIPEKLYGREKEVEQLLGAYQRVSRGEKEMILLAGYSGTGKTSLVNEIHMPITRDHGYFISGKFDQLQRTVPYFAFIQALNHFCQLLLTERQETLALWRERILKAVGKLGKVLTDIIPQLGSIIGKQPDVPEVGGDEAKIRFNFIFQRFLQAVSIKEHPLVMFIDDLQWADLSSLELLKLLMTDIQNRFFLFIGAYRDNEVSQTHPLTITTAQLRQQNLPVFTIPIKNLARQDIMDWLRDTLRGDYPFDKEDIKNLSGRIYRKTHGNAFFTVQFLENLFRQGLLTFDSSRCGWTWDLEEIDRQDITDNVVDLILHRIKSHPSGVQDILKLASCIGNIFDLETLSVIAGKDMDVRNSLEIALEEDLIYLHDDEKYKFGHDRIQQAAYALIPEDDKKQFHLKIGRLLVEKLHLFEGTNLLEVSDKVEQKIFDIVNHLNIGKTLLKDEKEEIRVVQLNHKAAQKAKAATAYQSSWEYIQQAIQLLPANSIQNYRDLTLSLYNEAVQISYSSGNYAEINYFGDYILKNAVKIIDKSTVYEYQIMGLIAQNKFTEAVDMLLELLKGLGINIPRKIQEEDMGIFTETKALLEKKGPEGLKALPPMSDEKKQLAMRLYLRTSTAISIAAQDMYRFIVNRMLLLSLQYGKTPETPYLLTEYGFFCVIMGNISDGYKYGHISMELWDKQPGMESTKVRMLQLNYTYILHWKLHYKDVAYSFWEIYQDAVQAGDLEFAAYAIICYFVFLRYVDERLPEVEQKGKNVLEITEQLKQSHQEGLAITWHRVIENLLGVNQNPTQLDDTKISPHIVSEDSRRMQEFYRTTSQLFLFCHFNHNEVLDRSELLRDIPLLASCFEYPNYVIYSTVIKLQIIKTTVQSQKEKLLQEVRENLIKIEEWADFGPRNFLHRHYLIKAELANVTGKLYEAGEYYDKAIETAKKNEFLCDEALSNELTARFYQANQRESLAEFYFQRAYHCYRRWGAAAKVKHLEEHYPKYLSMEVAGGRLSSSGTISSASTDATGELLDVQSIIKASQTLSGEVKLASLLEKMVQILLENAGAQRCLLIESIDDRLLIQAEGTADGVSGILERQPMEESGKVPLSVINYVARSGKKLVCDNISKDPAFSSDDYIQKRRPESVVCFPIVRKDELSAIIYLENNLVEGAFTPARLNVLNTLSSQIAISIENARIYRDLAELNKSLEQKVAERTRQLEEMDKIKSRFFANISHEFRTPLTLIMGPLEQKLSQCRDHRQIEEMRMMMRNSQRLLTLINQLLDLSKLESGRMQLQAAEQDIVPFLNGWVGSFESLALQNKLDLIIQTDLDMFTLYFDAEKLEKVVTNLLANAFKFTPSGGEISVTAVAHTDGNETYLSGYLEIAVRDTGIGIPEDQLAYVFDRFYQAGGPTDRERRGTGIGLALARELVELHHGDISVHSTAGRGSTFTLRLPLGAGHLETVEIAAETGDLPAVEMKSGIQDDYSVIPADIDVETDGAQGEETGEDYPDRGDREKEVILVVEDNPDVRAFIRGPLEADFTVVEAADGSQGIEKAGEIIPDLIISDIMMPKVDGYELCRTLKTDVKTSHVPVILLTAKASEESVIAGLETGADDYITKPFNAKILLTRIRNLIDLRRGLQEKIQREMVLQPTEIAVSSIDQKFMQDLKEAIEKNISDPEFNINKLAGSLYMARSTLNLKIRAITGESTNRFIQSFRLKRAAQLLKARFGNVTEVAFEVGFSSSAYFTRCFKEKFHQLPHTYMAAEGEG